jgi:hypothetical protein
VLETQVEAITATTGEAVMRATADAGYDYGRIYGGLERRVFKP